MPYIDFDVDVNDFLDSCSEDDIQEIIERLIENGFLTAKEIKSPNDSPRGYDESVYESSLDKLHGRWNMLSSEEEQQILKISNRLP